MAQANAQDQNVMNEMLGFTKTNQLSKTWVFPTHEQAERACQQFTHHWPPIARELYIPQVSGNKVEIANIPAISNELLTNVLRHNLSNNTSYGAGAKFQIPLGNYIDNPELALRAAQCLAISLMKFENPAGAPVEKPIHAHATKGTVQITLNGQIFLPKGSDTTVTGIRG